MESSAARASRLAIEAIARKKAEQANPTPKPRKVRKAPRHIEDYESRMDDLGESPDY